MGLAVVVACLAAASCLDPTEITVEIETDLDCAEIVRRRWGLR